MKFSNLFPQTLDKIKSYSWDRIIDKHEGPESWDWTMKYKDLEFIDINGYHVLLPVDKDQHLNITVLRLIESKDEKFLTIFFQDTTHVDTDNQREVELCAGFMAVCEKVDGEHFYVAIVYHEWFIN